MVDWIELIPIAETRNYVQRVTENVVMYRTARGDIAPILKDTPWTR
jgi:soluble lytic murein transglycosylase